MPAPRLDPPGYPDIVRSDEDRERFARLYDDLVRVVGLDQADALLHAATQFQLGFDVRGALEKRKRRKKVSAFSLPDDRGAPDREPPPSMDPPGT